MTHHEGFFQRTTEERIPLRGEQVHAPAGVVHVPSDVAAPVGDRGEERVLEGALVVGGPGAPL